MVLRRSVHTGLGRLNPSFAKQGFQVTACGLGLHLKAVCGLGLRVVTCGLGLRPESGVWRGDAVSVSGNR